MARALPQIFWKTFFTLLAVAVCLGSIGRFTDLSKKPMHTDEAILAMKTQEFWRTGFFKYDPKDYHGPFIHHATRALGTLRGWSPDTLNEEQVRWTVAVFGIALMLLPLLMIDVLGRAGTVAAIQLAAVSSMMTYYSRYYIMETAFVFQVALFMICLWRWSQGRNYLWLIVAGVCLGWMHATKETFVLNIAAIAAAWMLVRLCGGSFAPKASGYSLSRKKSGSKVLPWFVTLSVAAFTSVWLFSNGFKDWQGVLDSVMTYQSYLTRSGGSGHEKPWYFYLTLIFYRRDGFVWSEAVIGGLAILGMLLITADERKGPRRVYMAFLSVYAVILLGIYCIIPYKTPWSIMAVQYAFILLGGYAFGVVLSRVWAPIVRVMVFGLFGVGVYQLGHQTSLATDYAFAGQNRFAADARNPYVYSHTSTNVLELSRRVHELASLHGDGLNMPVQVVQSEQGWPLPWYLRDMPRVGYQATLPPDLNAPVVIVDQELEEQARGLLKANVPVNKPKPLPLSAPGEPVFDIAPAPPEVQAPLTFIPDSALADVVSLEDTVAQAPQPAATTAPPPIVFDFSVKPEALPPPPPVETFVAYESGIYGLRPGITLSLLVRKDLWELFLEKQNKARAAAPAP